MPKILKQFLTEIYFALEESETPIVQEIKSISNKLHSLENFHPGIEALNQKIAISSN